MSPGRSSLRYFKRSLYNLYSATGFLPWFFFGLSFCYSSTSLTKIAKPEHSTLLRPNCHPKTPGINRATGAFFLGFPVECLCRGKRVISLQEAKESGAFGKLWWLFLVIFWIMNLSKNQNQRRVKRWSYIYIYSIWYIIYHICTVYSLTFFLWWGGTFFLGYVVGTSPLEVVSFNGNKTPRRIQQKKVRPPLPLRIW